MVKDALFPFLIGKVLTRHLGAIEERAFLVSIPYR